MHGTCSLGMARRQWGRGRRRSYRLGSCAGDNEGLGRRRSYRLGSCAGNSRGLWCQAIVADVIDRPCRGILSSGSRLVRLRPSTGVGCVGWPLLLAIFWGLRDWAWWALGWAGLSGPSLSFAPHSLMQLLVGWGSISRLRDSDVGWSNLYSLCFGSRRV